ncbi:MAG: carboxylating nicotinate-nucleotide diphosphorylase [Phycisphaerales bacterium]|nr:carboxylating nicotinate-nucleotide diphosphorylase [Phycisphaerales bacterium]
MTGNPDAATPAALWERLASGGLIHRLIDLAHDEDLGAGGDVTSAACLSPATPGRARIIARAPGVISGLAALPIIMPRFAPGSTFTVHCQDGTNVRARTDLATLTGPLTELLAAERTILNLLGRLSGVATLTATHVAALPPGCRARVYDTRKTTPGLRVLEKYAVRCGGGLSHRLGLHDAVLIKDNHIASVPCAQLARFVADAAARARANSRIDFVQVEADTLDQFESLLSLPRGTIDIVLLDNMTTHQLRHACTRRDQVNPGLELEASGGVTLSTLPAIASTGVDRISIGALTHHAVSLDVAMDVDAA